MLGLYDFTERSHNFFEGRQWVGLESGGEQLPFYNIVQPICEHKIASVAQNNMTIRYTPFGYGDQIELCNLLNDHASRVWERQKLERKCWDVIKESCISGDSYLYFFNSNLDSQIIDNTNIHFGDEQQPDLQKQPYILIFERRNVEDVKKEARENGVETDLIIPDEDVENLIGDREEVGDKCTSLLYLEKKDGEIHFTRATRNIVYQPETKVDGLILYPIASLVWMRKKNSSRGNGEVSQLIPNQIAINRLLARREISTKMTAFPKAVYSDTFIQNPEDIDKVGSAIRVSGNVQRVNEAFAYISPSGMSSDAGNLQSELISQTRELAGAGDAALGNINPERASGSAIIAIRDQSAIPLNEQISLYRQFVEDIALIFYNFWKIYNTQGILIESQMKLIPPEKLKEMKVDVRVDVSPTNVYAKFSQEQAVENALAQQRITFEEYVEALDEDSTAPKQKFQEILKKRQANPMIGEQNGQAMQM